MGETYTRRRMALGRVIGSPNSYRYLLVGLGALAALWLAWSLFGWVPVAGNLIRGAAFLVTWLLATAGFGAALLSRAGIRENFAGRLIPPEALTDEYLWATPQFGVPPRGDRAAGPLRGVSDAPRRSSGARALSLERGQRRRAKHAGLQHLPAAGTARPGSTPARLPRGRAPDRARPAERALPDGRPRTTRTGTSPPATSTPPRRGLARPAGRRRGRAPRRAPSASSARTANVAFSPT